jgi:hypothetical protein
MANAIYTNAKNLMLTAGLDLSVVPITAVLVDAADYVFSDAHTSLADVPAIGRLASAPLTTIVVAGNVFDADNILLNNVSGDVAEAVILYHDTGVEATSSLIAYIDTGTGLPVTPTGADIVITWDNGENKIFAL